MGIVAITLAHAVRAIAFGAPVNPAAAPMPSISSQRGQGFEGAPFSARSITRRAIFSTTVFEIKFGDAVAFEIGCGIQKIDCVGHAVLDGEFDGVHFVAERLIDGLRIFDDARAELGRKIIGDRRGICALSDRSARE